MLAGMRWNPFRPKDELAPMTTAAPKEKHSSFEDTLIEDLPRSGFDPAAAHNTNDPTLAADAAMPGEIGQIGRFLLRSVLGQGGLGTVYAAWDPLLSRSVAVKTLRVLSDAAMQDAAQTLLLNEARAAARLSHPHIVTVFDAGLSDQGVYIAMEPLRGLDLRKLLQQGWHPTPFESANLVRRVADALAYAHGKGVVHCDVKPANIFMVDRKQPKVLDFGIARQARRDGTSAGGPTAGSPYYLAPEQIRGDAIDRRCDVYSLGVVLYELLTGRVPFTGDSLEEITRSVLTTPTPSARRNGVRVPAGLSAIAARAMARAPEDRYPSARHLSNDLREWMVSAEARTLARSPEEQYRKAMALGALVLVTVAGVVWWQIMGRRSDTPVTVQVTPSLTASAPTAALPAPVASAIEPVVLPTSGVGSVGVSAPASAPVIGASSPSVASPSAASVPSDQSAALAPITVAPASTPAPAPAPVRPPATARAESAKPAAPATRTTAQTAAATPAPSRIPTGTVVLLVTPWGQVEVDGIMQGITPPLRRLTLPQGRHTVTVRNTDYPSIIRVIEVNAESPVIIQHRFGP
jgi:hypothetical protein